MGFKTDTLTPTLATLVFKLEKQVLRQMERCCTALRATGTGPNAALQRWFGDVSPAFRKEMLTKVARMRSILNATAIDCRSEATTVVITSTGQQNSTRVLGTQTKILGGDDGTNAESTFTPGGLFGGGGTVGKVTGASTGFIRIGVNFKNLADTALGGASAWLGQDKLETLLHELSHYVHDTNDELLTDGTEAYEAQNARLLVTQSVALAKTNAENWGFFIEECGA